MEHPRRLWEMICSCAIGQAIHVAVELRIPELLIARPLTSAELATETSSDLWSLEAVIRCLTAFEVLDIDKEQRFSLTSTGKSLLRSAPGSFADEAGVFFDSIYRPLGGLLDMVKTGGIAFDRIYGMPFYEHLKQNAELEASFYEIMRGNAPNRYAHLSAVYDFSAVRHIVDVGGGEAALLVQILNENTFTAGLLFDLPGAIDRARSRLEEAGLSNRCQLVAGDFFESIPPAGDLYVMAQILNNWRDNQARRILTNCRAAMTENARLLVLEPVHVPGEPIMPSRALISLAVMAQRGGRTRSEPELSALFASAGLRLDSIRQIPSSTTSVIVVSPI